MWWSTRGAVDQARSRTILDRRVDPQVAAVVRRFRLLQATAPVQIPALPELGMWPRWCMPVRFAGRVLGLLWVLGAAHTDLQLAIWLAAYRIAPD